MTRTYLVVGSVHEDLIHDLEEARDIRELPVHHPPVLTVPGPHGLGNLLHAPDVGVRSQKNMLQLRELQ